MLGGILTEVRPGKCDVRQLKKRRTIKCINGDIASREESELEVKRGITKEKLLQMKMEARNFLYSNWILSAGKFLI